MGLSKRQLKLLKAIEESESSEFNTDELNREIRYQRPQDLRAQIARLEKASYITTQNYLRKERPDTDLIAVVTSKGIHAIKKAYPTFKPRAP